jgi:outer membrane lipoprotein-sorting protein
MHMKAVIALAACLAAPAHGTAQAQDEDARALAAVDSYRAFDEAGFSYDFASSGEEGESLMRVAVRTRGEEAALVRYLEPAKQRGRLVLVRGNSFWLLDKDMKQPIRISPRQLLFGQASAGDISRISFRTMYSVQGRERSGGGIVLRLAAKSGAGATYERVDLRTDSGFRPVEAACMGRSGVLIKTIRYEKYERIGGRELLTEFTIVDAVSGKKESVRLSNFDSATPPDSAFAVQALRFQK